MNPSTRPKLPPEAALNELLRLVLQDRASGRERSLAEYQALFAGHEELIARELGADRSSIDSAAVMDEAREQRFGSYRLIRPLGRGGQGQVWLAEDTRLPRTVALKLLDRLAFSREALERFQREGQIASRLDDPGICTVYEAGSEDGIPFLALRYVPGATLAERLEEARGAGARESSTLPLPAAGEDEGTRGPDLVIERVMRLVERLARSLHVAHERGIVHRDVKPGNVIVGDDGLPVVLDFGLARAQDALQPTVTRTGDVFGTPAYMAPEQIRGESVDRRADVWGLGVLLYECLTLVRPFEGPTRESLYSRILTSDPRDPREHGAPITDDLALVVATALEKDPARRYGSAQELAEDLRHARRGEPIAARRPSLYYRARKFAGRHRALVAATSAAICALALGLGATLRALGIAERNATLAREQTERVLRLADVKRHRDLVEASRTLWPADPRHAGDFERWLEEADKLVTRLPEHRTQLAQLRDGALPVRGPTGNRLFSDTETAWQHDTLADLVDDLESFADLDPAVGTVANVRARLAFARTIERRSIEEKRARWDEAIRSIADTQASPQYAGLLIRPQLGLVPIGPDLASGLQEFAHVQTGDVPTRRADGRLEFGTASGLVFVLMPGGRAWIGSQRVDSAGPNYDPTAENQDGPASEVEFEPFFLSRFEMTQAQWERFTGSNPSHHPAGDTVGGKLVTALHPVEQTSWILAAETVANLGLMLPSDAQWEYAARAGTDTIWSTGGEPSSLAGHANLADEYCRSNGGPASWTYTDGIDDGYTAHAPVGSFAPNRFGLHDMHGNVWEWCSHDREHEAARIALLGDDASVRTDPRNRVHRGGAFDNPASGCRSGLRYYAAADYRRSVIGLRPARVLER